MATAVAEAPRIEIEYDELELEVSRCLCDQGEVRVLRSRFGRPRERFMPTFDPQVMHLDLERLDELMFETTPNLVDERRTIAKDIGKTLYESLFPGRIRETFGRSLAAMQALRGHREAGLRLRLSFGEANRYLSDVVGLPWELICAPDSEHFPVSSPETPLVRYLDVDQATQEVKIAPPIRILAVLSSPEETELPPIDRPRHLKLLHRACETDDRLELLPPVDPPTLSNLHRELHRLKQEGRPVHVVHFFGHGTFDEAGEGLLYFETPERRASPVRGQALAQILGGFRELRLAVLSTCKGGRMMRRAGQHPFAGAASALVARGLPAVVGMQFPVSVEAAGHFTSSFYEHLAAGLQLEAAVTQGRLHILSRDADGFEWASPVLFLRSREGSMAEPSRPASAPAAQRREPRVTGRTVMVAERIYQSQGTMNIYGD